MKDNFPQIVRRIANLIAYQTPLAEIRAKVIGDLNGSEEKFFLYYKAAQVLRGDPK